MGDRVKRTRVRVASFAALAVVAMMVWAPVAVAVYGDEYGAAPINDHPDAVQDAPAIPSNHAFWAGACDRSAAPGFDVPLATVGNQTGFGARPSTVLAGTADEPRIAPPIHGQTPVPAAQSPDHCLDWGAHTAYLFRDAQQGQIWQRFPYDLGRPHSSGSGVIGQTLPGCTFADGPPFPDACDHAPRWRLPAETKAGAHPDGTSMLVWSRNREGVGAAVGSVEGSVDNIYVDLPPGFVGNPQAVPQCTSLQFREQPPTCPPQSQVGVLRLNLQGEPFGVGINMPDTLDNTLPVFNLEPRKGNVAELGLVYAGSVAAIRLVADARTNGDFGVTAFTGQIPAALIPVAQQITLWGVPWAAENDEWRAKVGHYADPVCRAGAASAASEFIPPGGLPGASCRAVYDPSWGEVKPFLTNETDCNPAPTVRLATDSFQHQGTFTVEGDPDLPAAPELLTGVAADLSGWKTYASPSPAVTGCGDLDFEPELDLDPTSAAADGASGLRAELGVSQNNRPRDGGGGVLDPGAPGYLADASAYWDSDAGRATAHLKDSVVTLPAGVSLNPSAATGLEACSDAGIGLRGGTDAYSGRRLFNNGDPFNKDEGADGAECPDGSKIGTALVNTPLLGEPLVGEVVLGEPKSTDPRSGEMFRLFIVVRDPDRGLVAKIYGSTKADGTTGSGAGTGQLVTTFENNPEVPFDSLELDIKGGERGVLALPADCGGADWSSTFTSWSSVGAVSPVPAVDGQGSFTVDSRCAQGFSPSLDAGSSDDGARASTSFKFRFARDEGDRYLRGLTAKLPQGLLASVKDVPLCSNAQADAGQCPQGSRIGVVDAKAGSGDPFVLEEKGEVFLTEGYKGGAYGLAVKVRPVAGPFRGQMELSSIIVRQAIHVDRRSAQVTAVSDPFPLIHHGVPLRVREVTVLVNRDRFMLNPSDCDPKQVGGDLASDQNTTVALTNPFRATGCAGLRFRPKLALRLTGRRQVTTGKHPGIRAQVTQQGVPEAGIEKAVVRLPKSLALDVNNAQALCEFVDGTKPDLENHCPKGSIVGRARAVSPLLNDPLVGNVYFVKNVRVDPETGNQIRTLPMIVVALRGEIAVNLKGESDTTRAGKLVNTFNGVPDAPVSQFNLNINGGKTGILAVTRTRRSLINLCASGRHVAEADMDGHNGRRHDFDVRMKTPCTKRQTRAAKRKAKRAAARADSR